MTRSEPSDGSGLSSVPAGYRGDMERGSSKHGRIMDEEMAREVEAHTRGGVSGSRADEARDPEPAGDDQPEPNWIPAGTRPAGAPAPLTGEELEERSRLGRWIPRSVLPADKATLVSVVTEAGGPPDVLAELERLPADCSFGTIYQIWQAAGGRNEPTSSTGQ